MRSFKKIDDLNLDQKNFIDLEKTKGGLTPACKTVSCDCFSFEERGGFSLGVALWNAR